MAYLNRMLSLNAGYVDTASFLAIHGLFAAHVTGNFVTLGAALVTDNHAGTWAKMSALPMFCLTILYVKLLDQFFIRQNKTSYTTLLKIMLLCFILASLISVFYLPFPLDNTWASFIVGMLLVAAMAIQNAMHRIHWIKESPTTVMTGSTTQLMLDVAELFSNTDQDKKTIIKQRFKAIFPTMLSFAIGCALAAIVYKFALLWLFVIPPILMALIYWKREHYKKA